MNFISVCGWPLSSSWTDCGVLPEWAVDISPCWLVDWAVGMSPCWLMDWAVDMSPCWLMDWAVDVSPCWLMDWVVDMSLCWLMEEEHCSGRAVLVCSSVGIAANIPPPSAVLPKKVYVTIVSHTCGTKALQASFPAGKTHFESWASYSAESKLLPFMDTIPLKDTQTGLHYSLWAGVKLGKTNPYIPYSAVDEHQREQSVKMKTSKPTFFYSHVMGNRALPFHARLCIIYIMYLPGCEKLSDLHQWQCFLACTS